MLIFEKIQSILDKGLDGMKIYDQHEMSKCINELYVAQSDKRRERRYLEQELNLKEIEIKSFGSDRMLELKEEKTKEGKNLTVEVMKAVIYSESKEKTSELGDIQYKLDEIQTELDLIYGKIQTTSMYRIDIRDSLNTFNYTPEQ